MINNFKLLIKPVFFLLLLLNCQIILFSQEESRENSRGYDACIFLNVNLSEEDAAEYEEIIYEILSVELENLNFSIAGREIWEPIADEKDLDYSELLAAENAISVAAAADAAFAITGFYYIERNTIILEFKCYKVENKALVASFLDSGRTGLSLHNLIYSAITELLPKILAEQELVVEIDRDVITVSQSSDFHKITLLSIDDGMEIYLSEDTLLGVISNGVLSVNTIPFSENTEIVLTKIKEGYKADEEVIQINEQEQEIILEPMKRERPFAAELFWTTGQMLGLGAGFRFYIIPDSFYISADDYLYMQYGFKENSSAVFHNDLRVMAGKYLFFPEDFLFQMGLSAGFGCIFSFYAAPNQKLYADFYINFANLWTEWNIRHWAIFLRVEGKYSLGIGRNLLGKGFMMADRFGPPVTIGVIRKW